MLTPLAHVRVAVDVMGGDHGPEVVVPACQQFLHDYPAAELVLVGTEQALKPTRGWARCQWVVASEVVEMDDPVEVALRKKRDSSMRQAIKCLRPHQDEPARADVCVSAGNTGALMAVARFVLKMMPGIDRPAIASVIPHQRGGYTTMLDLGANVDCTEEHLLEFAILGSALVTAVYGKQEPLIGLLNIGSEEFKGSDVIKRAGDLLRSAHADEHLNYHGNVEGNDIFKGTVDVVVCDGFVGNVALKTTEGLASMLGFFIREEFSRHWWTRLAALAAMPVLRRFRRRVDPRGFNGAALLGLQGLVVKSHGSADVYAFSQALARAHDAARNRLTDRVRSLVDETMQGMPGEITTLTAAPAA